MHSFVFLEPPEVGEGGPRGAGRGDRGVGRGIDAWVDHLHVLARDSAVSEIVRGALADGLEGNAAIDASQWALGEPNGSGERSRELLKDGAPEQVRNEGDDASNAMPARCVERNLVHVLDEHVE